MNMKKMILLVLTAFFFFAKSHAQQKRERFDPLNDKRVMNGYTVRLIPAIGGGFGYDILENNKIVLHQYRSPMPFFPKGVAKKEDAYKLADWAIGDYKAHGHWSNMVPPHVARELKIETH
jgi:hypothetical protein